MRGGGDRNEPDTTKLFVDANIFLSFYQFTSDDLAQLNKLAVLIDDKKLELLLPQQVIDETQRNRDKIVNRSLKQFEGLPSLQIPSYIRHHEKYHTIREREKALAAIHSELLTDLRARIDAEQLDADVLIAKLFSLATTIKTTSGLVARSKQRVALGNPPGKGQSIRDALNWESLLQHVPSGTKLVVISNDGDYASPLDKRRLSTFLRREWKREKSTDDLYYYRTLSEFVTTHHLDIELKAEAAMERNILIDDLQRSNSFWITHKLIGHLNGHDHFTLGEAERLVGALHSNDQVRLIAGDPDVRGFFVRIRDSYGDDMSETFRDLLKRHLE